MSHIYNIDLIYLWVDGGDEKWLNKKQHYTGNVFDNTESNCKGRYVDNNELKYSLRSISKNLPWIRKIFIVTDCQTPKWININNPKIQIIDHSVIMPPETLPCFNTTVIEYYLYKIPGLSERFLIANDDLFVNKKLTPDYFFNREGYPIVRLKRKLLGRWHYFFKKLVGLKIGQYSTMLLDSSLLIEEKFGVKYTAVPHHNIDAYCREDYTNAVEQVFTNQINISKSNQIRNYGDLHRSAFSYYILAIKHAELKYVGRKQSSRILPYKHNLIKYYKQYNPDLFCINDNQRVTDNQRKEIQPFLELVFPLKSEFEI